jgi:hypothetical protein
LAALDLRGSNQPNGLPNQAIYIKDYFYILGLSSHNINSQRTHFLGLGLDPETEQNGLSSRGVEGLRKSGGKQQRCGGAQKERRQCQQ